jgi:RNA polymerase sigma factor (TIGR02999 family)
MAKPNLGQVTELLQRWKSTADPHAEQELFRLVYAELVQIAQRTLHHNPGFDHKIEAAELVNQAYLALRDYPILTENRAAFFMLMGRAMRHYLMDLGRKARAGKRPQSVILVRDTNVLNGVPAPVEIDLLPFFEAVDALKAVSERQAEILELWMIQGRTLEEIASVLGIGEATVKRDIKRARTFVAFKLGRP